MLLLIQGLFQSFRRGGSALPGSITTKILRRPADNNSGQTPQDGTMRIPRFTPNAEDYVQ